MAWNLSSERPIYLQLMEKIETDIISGIYKPGDKLSSVRELAAEAAVNPNTMQKALAELERKNLVYSQRTSGRFITEDQEMIKEMRDEIALQQIKEFLQRMQLLGFTKEEVENLILQNSKGGNEYE
ncbi:MAG TPA: GntR family transcriptional regulator [Candidatus Merdenecus merdavium]|nr:GntR family transcriptional regulator [Candidatus Merdenecus merdavium]